MTPLISIIHPSRSRPEQAAETAKRWLTSAKNPDAIEYILSLDCDDNSDYAAMFGYELTGYIDTIHMAINDNQNAVQAINAAAKISSGRIIVCISDDFACPAQWDKFLIEQLHSHNDFIVKTDDGYQPWIITLPIMDRAYYNRFGYVYYPEYSHMFCDTELSAVADLLDRKITLPIIFRHNHYSLIGAKEDDVSRKANNTWVAGERLYLNRLQNNFGLNPDEIKGVLRCDFGHIKWLQSKGIIVEYT